jgi:hypothetical protein
VVLLYIELVPEQELTHEKKLTTLQLFRQLITENLRAIDQAFEYSAADLEFAILLMDTSSNGVETIKSKVNRAIEKTFEKQFNVAYRVETLHLNEKK